MAVTTNFETAITAVAVGMNASDKLKFAEMIYEKALGVSKLTDLHPVLTGVRTGQVVPILKDNLDYGAFPYRTLGTCDVATCSINANFSSVKFELGNIECKIDICLEQYSNDFNLFFNEYKKASSEADEVSGIVQFMANLFVKNLQAAEWRVAYFGDKTSTNPLLNGGNGFFTQMQTRPAQIVPIVENTATTYAGQMVMTGQRVFDILEVMYNKYAEQPWFGADNTGYSMTRATASKLVAYLNSLKNTDCCNGISRASINGIMSPAYTLDNLMYNAIPIKVVNEWDAIINSDKVFPLNQGANARVAPHRIVLTYRENLVIGCSNADQIGRYKQWFSQDSNKVFMQGGSELGAHIPLKDEFILAI